MNITIRMYNGRRNYANDLDLILLYLNPNFDFFDALKQSLIHYVRGEPFFIVQPPIYTSDKIPQQVQCHIILDDTDEKDVSEFLSKLKPLSRNAFLKNLLRSSFLGFNGYVYLKEIDDNQVITDYFDKMKGSQNPVSFTKKNAKPRAKRQKKEFDDGSLMPTELEKPEKQITKAEQVIPTPTVQSHKAEMSAPVKEEPSVVLDVPISQEVPTQLKQNNTDSVIPPSGVQMHQDVLKQISDIPSNPQVPDSTESTGSFLDDFERMLDNY